MEAPLAYLSMIDPEAFTVAFTAVTPASDDHFADDEPIPLCGVCHSPIAIFPDQGLNWRHFHGDAMTTGSQEIHDPGHTAKATWYLHDETQKTSSRHLVSARRASSAGTDGFRVRPLGMPRRSPVLRPGKTCRSREGDAEERRGTDGLFRVRFFAHSCADNSR
jgi:hypothetical protein